MDIKFPVEFVVHGTPISVQAKRPEARDEWKKRIRDASKAVIPEYHFASDDRMSVTLFYLPEVAMQGDIDNIVKPILDALGQHIYIDDVQVERIVVQKFGPRNVFSFQQPSEIFLTAINGEKPILYIRVSNNPEEDLT